MNQSIQTNQEAPTPGRDRTAIPFSLAGLLQAAALKALEEAPTFIRPMVAETAEHIVANKGGGTVTAERFQRLIDEYTPPSLMGRIDTSE